MTAKEKVKFGIVGCGHIGKRHAEMVKRHPEAELMAVCDPRPAEETRADQLGVPVFTDLETMLREVPNPRSAGRARP